MARSLSVAHGVLVRGVVSPSRHDSNLLRNTLTQTLSPYPFSSCLFYGLSVSSGTPSNGKMRIHSQQTPGPRDQWLVDAVRSSVTAPPPAAKPPPVPKPRQEDRSSPQTLTSKQRRQRYYSRVDQPSTTPSQPSRGSALHKLVERAVSRGLLPVITARQTGVQWTVTISLHEIAWFVDFSADTRADAEAAAVSQLDSLLSSSDVFRSYPPTGPTLKSSFDTVVNYGTVVLGKQPQLSVLDHSDNGYTAQLYFDGKPATEPVSSATRGTAIALCKLAAAHKMISGHPDFWPVGTENPFQPSILVDEDTVDILKQVAVYANAILDTSKRGIGQEHAEVGKPYLDNCLGVLPFTPAISKMLVLGAITGSLNAAIIFAAVHSPSVMETMTKTPTKVTAAHDSDHLGYVTTIAKLQRPVEKTSNATQDCHNPLKRHGLETIRSIGVAAQEVEEALEAAGLVKPDNPSRNIYKELPGTELKLRVVPYGHAPTSASYRVTRHFLPFGFGHNIARYDYESLMPDTAKLRNGLQRVNYASVMKPSTFRERLTQIGPLAIFSGKLESRDSFDATMVTPITSLQAALLGSKLDVPEVSCQNKQESAPPEFVDLLVNGCIPVLVRSNVNGLAHHEARHQILHTRQLLHRAIDAAMVNFFKYGWENRTLYRLLNSLPVKTLQPTPEETVKASEQTRPLTATTPGLTSKWF